MRVVVIGNGGIGDPSTDHKLVWGKRIGWVVGLSGYCGGGGGEMVFFFWLCGGSCVVGREKKRVFWAKHSSSGDNW